MRKIFIIGLPRTGSKMYRYILNAHSDIDIMQEMHFLAPMWLHRDFERTVRHKVGDLGKDSNITALLDLMYSGTLEGNFWQNIQLDRKQLQLKIMESDRSLRSILGIVLEMHALSEGKTSCGAKFPVHFSYAPRLLEWFPNSKIIHITRDPRAIYSSQARKYTRNSDFALKNALVRMQMFAYITLSYRWPHAFTSK